MDWITYFASDRWYHFLFQNHCYLPLSSIQRTSFEDFITLYLTLILEDGWQPLPTIMIRPADDHHLPTANTCISRLYVPLYSSRKILRAKLLIAIKARNFGFVWFLEYMIFLLKIFTLFSITSFSEYYINNAWFNVYSISKL